MTAARRRASCCEPFAALGWNRKSISSKREKPAHVTSGSSPEGSAVGYDGGRMEPAGQPGRLLPPDRALWLGRSGRHPHLGARAGAGASLPDQPLRPDVRRDHRFQPGEGRPRRQPAHRRARTASTRPASRSIRRSTKSAKTPAACFICTRPTAPRSRAAWKACCR